MLIHKFSVEPVTRFWFLWVPGMCYSMQAGQYLVYHWETGTHPGHCLVLTMRTRWLRETGC